MAYSRLPVKLQVLLYRAAHFAAHLLAFCTRVSGPLYLAAVLVLEPIFTYALRRISAFKDRQPQ